MGLFRRLVREALPKIAVENGGPNLMIYKPAIKYMYKEGENER